jgi:hypothetical protein|tara:strand:+ start:347 stop:508 length:162 start_codon:yes stop_codon:yes gene_type:complete
VEQGIMLVQQEVEDLLTHKQTDLEVMQVLTPEVVEVEDLTITVITKVAMEDQV